MSPDPDRKPPLTPCAGDGCDARIRMDEMYHCFFCDRWFCKLCSRLHFLSPSELERDARPHQAPGL